MEEGESNNDASKNKSSCRSGKPPKLHSLEEAFQEALGSPSSLHSVNGKWNHSPSWLQNAPSATSHLGPRSAKGQLVMCSLVDGRQREAEERGTSRNQSEVKHTKQYLKFYFWVGTGRGRKPQWPWDRVAALSLISVRNDLEQSWSGIHAKTMMNNLISVRHLRCKTKVCRIIEVGANQSIGLFPSSASPSVAGLPHTEGHGLRRQSSLGCSSSREHFCSVVHSDS